MNGVHVVVRAAVACAVLIVLGPGAVARDSSPAVFEIPAGWLQGFARPVSGEVIGYPWAYPGQAHALLTRAVDGTRRIEWEGSPRPPGPPTDPSCTSGTGASRRATARTASRCRSTACRARRSRRAATRRTVLGGGRRERLPLAFQTMRVGTFNELFGLMMLTVPRRRRGRRPRRASSVVGEAAGSQDYYMTFEVPVEAWTHARAEQARFNDGRRAGPARGEPRRRPAPYVVRSGTTRRWQRARSRPVTTQVVARRGRRRQRRCRSPSRSPGARPRRPRLTLPPVRAWEIHLLPHSHVDIGYSDPQPEVERKQWKNLRDAVALAAATAAQPAGGAVPLERRGPVVGRELPAAGDARTSARRSSRRCARARSACRRTTRTSSRGCARRRSCAAGPTARGGCAPSTACRSAGRRCTPTSRASAGPWCRRSPTAASATSAAGRTTCRRYPDGGDRIGDTLHALGDRPFWWVSPSGQERLLFWMAGRGYSLFHGMNTGADRDGRPADAARLRAASSHEKGYPYDLVQVRYTIGGDNGPVDPDLPEFVKAWNETFETPRLVIDTADAMFEAFERRARRDAARAARRHDAVLGGRGGLDGGRGGDGARARRGACSRPRRSGRCATRGAFPATAFDEAWRQVLLWHEHTWGAADSVSQPDRKDVVDQWVYKRAFAAGGRPAVARAARRRPRPAAAAAGAGRTSKSRSNTLSWPRPAPSCSLPADRDRGTRSRRSTPRGAAACRRSGSPTAGWRCW